MDRLGNAQKGQLRDFLQRMGEKMLRVGTQAAGGLDHLRQAAGQVFPEFG